MFWSDPAFGPGQYHALAKRRFGQESSSAIGLISNLPGCPGQICGVLSQFSILHFFWSLTASILNAPNDRDFFSFLGGGGITPLLAKADECAQQKHAEKVIEAALVSYGCDVEDCFNKQSGFQTLQTDPISFSHDSLPINKQKDMSNGINNQETRNKMIEVAKKYRAVRQDQIRYPFPQVRLSLIFF